MENQLTCQVVMFPIENVGELLIIGTKLVVNNNEYSEHYIKLHDYKSQHLYFVSDREIKEGDWYYHPDFSEIFKAYKDTMHNKAFELEKCKKIEAITDNSLLIHDNSENNKCFGTQLSGNCSHIVPQISKYFVEAFVIEQGDIKEVNIEMEIGSGKGDNVLEIIGNTYRRVKTNEDNTVIILPVDNYDGAPVEIIARELKKCASSWEPKVRLLGNVRAEDIIRLCDFLIKNDTNVDE